MSDAPEANAQAEDLQPITVDQHGLFWFSVFWLRFHFKTGGAERQRALGYWGMTRRFRQVLLACEEIHGDVYAFNRLARITLVSATLIGVSIGAAVGIVVTSKEDILGWLGDNHPEYTAGFVTAVLLAMGTMQLLVGDLHRQLYQLVDRYNIFVEVQARAKSESPAPPAAS